MIAASKANPQVARYLIGHGAQIDAKDDNDQTADNDVELIPANSSSCEQK